MLVLAGSDTHLNPWPLRSGMGSPRGVVTVTSIVALLFSTKFPRNLLAESLKVTLLPIPVQRRRSELMTAFTRFPRGLLRLTLLGTVNVSKTQILCASKEAVP